MHAGAVIARWTAPARVRQSTAKRVKRIAAVERRINRVAPRAASRSLRAQRIRHLVSLVAEVEHVSIPVRGDPRPVINKLRRRNQRTRGLKRYARQSIYLPARERVVCDIRVHEIEVVGVIQCHVTFITKLVLLNTEWRQALNVLPALACVAGNPVPGHAARVSRRIDIGSKDKLPVFLMRRGKHVSKTVGDETRLISKSASGRDFDRRPKRGALRNGKLSSSENGTYENELENSGTTWTGIHRRAPRGISTSGGNSQANERCRLLPESCTA